MIVDEGRPLFDLAPDYERECWTATTPARYGRTHVITVPWPERIRPICTAWNRGRANTIIRFGVRQGLVTCKLCLKQPLPLATMMPDNWPPPKEPTDALVLADWYDEHGMPYMADTWRRLAMLGEDQPAAFGGRA